MGRVWPSLETRAGGDSELNRRFCGESQEQNVCGTTDSGGCAPEFSEGKEDPLERTRGRSCYVLAKKLSAFCLGPETFWEAEFQGDGQINLVKEISKELLAFRPKDGCGF